MKMEEKFFEEYSTHGTSVRGSRADIRQDLAASLKWTRLFKKKDSGKGAVNGKIRTFELDRWSEPDEQHRVRHIGMADAKETFEKLRPI